MNKEQTKQKNNTQKITENEPNINNIPIFTKLKRINKK